MASHLPIILTGGLTPDQCSTILSLVSIAENDTTSWWTNYTYIQDIGDGRGYTINIVGFCTGTGDFLWLVENLASFDPGHPLCAFLHALEHVNGTASHEGLDGLVSLIKTMGTNEPYLKATWNAIQHFYWGPAMTTAYQYGLEFAVSKGQLYDISVNAGDFSILKLVKSKSPAMGGSESVWLADLQNQWKLFISNPKNSLDGGQVDRAEMWESIAKNTTLALPFKVTCYSDDFTL